MIITIAAIHPAGLEVEMETTNACVISTVGAGVVVGAGDPPGGHNATISRIPYNGFGVACLFSTLFDIFLI